MPTRRQELAQLKAAHNHPVYSVMSYVMGCGVQGRGTGSHVVDEHGRAFLALFDQYGNQSFGYNHQRVVAALVDQIDTGRLNSTKIMFEEESIRLTERLAAVTGGRLPFSYLANSGGETIDNALKLARAAAGRKEFVSAVDCFHGKTFGALSAAGRPEHASLFAPLLDGFHQVPFNDLDALARAIGPDTAAVILEPVQAEGGVITPAAGYLEEVRRLCTETGALLVLDEMQTAFGRCGTFFAFEQFGITPDLVCVGKAFGGGVLPISAVLGTAEVWHALRALPSTFGSSLGGNPLSCRVGLETLALASDEGFLAGVRDKALLLDGELDALAKEFPELVREHRGLGMMHGLEFHEESLGGLVLRLLYEGGVTSTYSLYNPRVLRVQPPMVISDEDLRQGISVLASVLRTVDGFRRGGAEPLRAAVTRSVALNASAEQVLHLLKARPRALDPFAADHDVPFVDRPGYRFRGTLGDDAVEWTDTLELSEDTVYAHAEPCWLWRRLDRTTTVRPGPGGTGCTLDIAIGWDCGTGPYEELLAGRISYFVQQRIADLIGRFTSAADRGSFPC